MVEWLEASAWGSERAFHRVELVNSVNLAEALERMVTAKDRLALVAPMRSGWESVSRDPEFQPRQRETLSVTVLVTDRRIGNLSSAVGGSDSNPGAARLRTTAIADLTGLLFDDTPRVNCRPVSDEMVGLQLEETGLRVCWSIDFECLMDWGE
jgi:hypothetical protein